MHYNHYLSPLAVTMGLAFSISIQASEALVLQQKSFSQLTQLVNISVTGFKKNPNGLNLIHEHTDHNQISHIRLQQYYAGYLVYGSYAILHSPVPASGLHTLKKDIPMNGIVYQGLQKELGVPEKTFATNKIKALNLFKSKFSSEILSHVYAIPIIYIDSQHHAHWAYKVSVQVNYKNKIPARPTAIVDAQTNKHFVEWNDLKTEKISVQGIGFGGNHKVGEYRFGNDLPFLEITRDPKEQTCYMENNEVRIVDMGHRYSSKNKAMEFKCLNAQGTAYQTGYNADGYDKENGAASPSNDALYTGYVIKHMYHDWYGVEVLNKSDGTPMQLVMRVHYGDNYENAYWDGRQMTFGDGDAMMYPLVSLGVGGHEVSHGFTEQHSNLEYYGQSGGMNESFSDMAAQAAEYYSLGKNDWSIGGEVMKETSGYEALRYMDKPSKDGESIDNADEYYGGIDVHYSSGVYNRLFYLIASKPGWNTRLAFDVMVKANMDYWTPYTSFEEGACGVISASKDLGFSTKDVRSALKDVAINTSSCESKSTKSH